MATQQFPLFHLPDHILLATQKHRVSGVASTKKETENLTWNDGAALLPGRTAALSVGTYHAPHCRSSLSQCPSCLVPGLLLAELISSPCH